MAARRSRKPIRGITHGRAGYQRGCGCDVCRTANAEYQAGLRQRKGREGPKKIATVTAIRKRSESKDSDPGMMERAVIEECDGLERATSRPTLVVAARNLAKIVDNPDMSGIHTATTKQIMAILTDLHGDEDKSKSTGRRKSGGRLATVGALTKVKREA